MMRILVHLAVFCFLWPSLAMAEDRPSVEKQELMAEAAAFMPWKGDLDGMIERSGPG